MNRSMSTHYTRWREKTVGRRTIKRGSARQVVDGKGFRLADEIAYIQDKAADHGGGGGTTRPTHPFSPPTRGCPVLHRPHPPRPPPCPGRDPRPPFLVESPPH